MSNQPVDSATRAGSHALSKSRPEFDGTFPSETIERYIAESIEDSAARTQTFLPIFVSRSPGTASARSAKPRD